MQDSETQNFKRLLNNLNSARTSRYEQAENAVTMLDVETLGRLADFEHQADTRGYRVMYAGMFIGLFAMVSVMLSIFSFLMRLHFEFFLGSLLGFMDFVCTGICCVS